MRVAIAGQREINIISEKLAETGQRLADIVSTCLKNLPETNGMDSETEQNFLIDYFTEFWSKSVSLTEEFEMIASVSRTNPLGAFQLMITCFPEKQTINLQNRDGFLKQIEPYLFNNTKAIYAAQLAVDIAQAVFLQQVMSRPVFLLLDDCGALFDLIYNIVAPQGDANMFPEVCFVSSVFWSDTLTYLSSLLNDYILDAILQFMEGISKMTVVRAITLFTFFSGFVMKDMGPKEFTMFGKSIAKVIKYMKKNYGNKKLDTAFVKFSCQFLTGIVRVQPSFKLEKEWKNFSDYSKHCIGKNDYSGCEFELYALYLVFCDHKKTCLQFIENELSGRLQKGSNLGNVLTAFVFILRGKNYESQKRLSITHNNLNWRIDHEFLSEKVIDNFFLTVVERETMFGDYQLELTDFLIQLAVHNFRHFMEAYFVRIMDQSFVNNNSIAVLRTMSYLIASHKHFDVSEECTAKLMQASIRAVTRFVQESKVQLAPMNMSIFSISSFVSAIQMENAPPLSSFLLNLREFSAPHYPRVNQTRERLDIIHHWQVNAPPNLKLSVLERSSDILRTTSGYIGMRDEKSDVETIDYLNIAALTNVDSKIATNIASFVLSSSAPVRSMAIHALQAIIHTRPGSFLRIINGICDLILICPVIESEHLYMILYTIQNILESVKVLRLQITDSILQSINGLVITGLCNSNHYVRSIAYNIAAFTEDLEENSIYDVIQRNKKAIEDEAMRHLKVAFCTNEDELIEMDFCSAMSLQYNNIWQYYLAAFAKYFRLESNKQVQNCRKYLMNKMEFFEIESAPVGFICNIIVFLVNSATGKLEDELINYYQMSFLDFSELGALFVSVDPVIVPQILIPTYELLDPMSVALVSLCEGKVYDMDWVLKILDQFVLIALERCEFSRDVENSVDVSVFHILHAIKIVFNDYWDAHATYHHYTFPIAMKCKLSCNISESQWIAFLMLVSSCTGTVEKWGYEAFNAFIRVVKPSAEMVDTLSSLRTQSGGFPLKMGFILSHYPNILNDYLEKSREEIAYFIAIAEQFQPSETYEQLKRNWNMCLESTNQDEGDLSTLIDENAGFLLATACYYMNSADDEVKRYAMNMYLSILYPMLKLNNVEPSIDYYSITKYRSESLSGLMSRCLVSHMSYLCEDCAMVTDQFIKGVLVCEALRQTDYGIKLVVPWFNDIVMADYLSERTAPSRRCLTLQVVLNLVSILLPCNTSLKLLSRITDETMIRSMLNIMITAKHYQWLTFVLGHFFETHCGLTLDVVTAYLVPEYSDQADEELCMFLFNTFVTFAELHLDEFTRYGHVIIPFVLSHSKANKKARLTGLRLWNPSARCLSDVLAIPDQTMLRNIAIGCLKWGFVSSRQMYAESGLKWFLRFNIHVDGYGKVLHDILFSIGTGICERNLNMAHYFNQLLLTVEFAGENEPYVYPLLVKQLAVRTYCESAAIALVGLLKSQKFVDYLRSLKTSERVFSEIMKSCSLDLRIISILKELICQLVSNDLFNLLVDDGDERILDMLLIPSYIFALDKANAEKLKIFLTETLGDGANFAEFLVGIDDTQLKKINFHVLANFSCFENAQLYDFCKVLTRGKSLKLGEIVSLAISEMRRQCSNSLLEFLAVVGNLDSTAVEMGNQQFQEITSSLPNISMLGDIY